jgi:hypothetical protein
MPVPFLIRFLPATLTGANRSGLALGVGWILTVGWAGAAGEADSTVGHLGFKYDPRVHEAAAAADRAAQDRPAAATTDDLLQLPKVVVTGKKQPLLARELLSPKGKLELANTTYISPVYAKTIGPLAAILGLLANPLGGWNANNPEAMALYEDDQQKRRNTEAQELSDLAKLSDQLVGDKK